MKGIKELTKGELRIFGVLLGSVIIAVFGVGFPLLQGYKRPLWPWIIAFAVWILSISFPNSLKLLYRLWMKVGALIGWIETRVFLIIVFYILVFPTGLMLRLFKKKLISDKFEPKSISYRIKSTNRTQKSMEKPF